MSHARDTPSRPRRTHSLTQEDEEASPLSRTTSKLFGTSSFATPPLNSGGRRRVNVGRPGETPKEVKEVELTPAEIRQARTFDPSDPVIYAERKAAEAAELEEQRRQQAGLAVAQHDEPSGNHLGAAHRKDISRVRIMGYRVRPFDLAIIAAALLAASMFRLRGSPLSVLMGQE